VWPINQNPNDTGVDLNRNTITTPVSYETSSQPNDGGDQHRGSFTFDAACA
jgi:hypothetical protein